ncbi:MAG: ABC transporter ATP-binding protein [Clostridiales Family XIII bacterium]|jgi:peptide/nickel transport system ATP-binding protein|nr:ABC transporter ATP-binding protein [Clostridiales Family XIII bacterium]
MDMRGAYRHRDGHREGRKGRHRGGIESNADKKGRLLLSVKDIEVHYETKDETVRAVNGVSFDLNYGETIGLVGETGAGKTTIARSILRILPTPPAKFVRGEVCLDGQDLYALNDEEMRGIRGNRISMVFQDPMTALNPVKRIGWQISEGIRYQLGLDKREADEKARNMLELVGISADRFREYPHQFSGGMKQRVILAIAIACSPDLIIADEPTSALDVTIQAQVLELIDELQRNKHTAMIMITHDFGVVAKSCNNVGVVYAGEIIEYGTVSQVFDRPMHPYTKGLFDAIPNLSTDLDRLSPILGAPPDPTNLPEGCKFRPRCKQAAEQCLQAIPSYTMTDGHRCKCKLYASEAASANATPAVSE